MKRVVRTNDKQFPIIIYFSESCHRFTESAVRELIRDLNDALAVNDGMEEQK